jgi:hypothetical protein
MGSRGKEGGEEMERSRKQETLEIDLKTRKDHSK